MKQAILVISFGTTHLDTLEKTICAVESDIQAANPDIPFFRAFTSPTVRRRLKEKYGMEVPSIEQAFLQIRTEGYTHVTVVPTLLLPGEEFDKLHAAILYDAGNLTVTIGLPLLWDDVSMDRLSDAIRDAYPLPPDTILMAMGHGTSHTADSVYARLRQFMLDKGMELCTVEGSIDFQAAIDNLQQQEKRKVHLVPLLLVAGDHSKNDMAGDSEDSLKSLLTKAGFEVSCSLQGLGEIPAVRQMYCERVPK